MFLDARRALLAATILCTVPAAPALAQDSGSAATLEARLQALEARIAELNGEVATLRGALADARDEAAAPAVAAVSGAPAAPLPAAGSPAPVQLAAAAPAPAPASSGPSVTLSGFIKLGTSFTRTNGGTIEANSIARDFYVPGAIPLGGAASGTLFEAQAKQSRLVASIAAPVGGHRLGGTIEADFQTLPGAGNQKFVNAYSFGLRRAFLTFDGLLAGQEWSNFQYTGALPETADYLGPSEGTVFVRQAQLRYTQPIGNALTLSVSAENPATTTAAQGTAAVTENAADSLPDATARLAWRVAGGELSLAGLVRQLRVGDATLDDKTTGWGVSFAGKLPFGSEKRHDLRFMVTHGNGIGRYVGLNLAPDAIVQTTNGDIDIRTVEVTAGFAALRLSWTDQLRSTVMGSFQDISYPDGLAVAAANSTIWSAAANLFYSPVAPLDLGAEFRHGQRELVSGATGALDRLELVARYRF